MERGQAKELIRSCFESPFDNRKFTLFLKHLLKDYEEENIEYKGGQIPERFRNYVDSLRHIGKYEDDNKKIVLLVVHLKDENTLERARALQRNLVAWYLKEGNFRAGLVAFVAEGSKSWRFSLVKLDYRQEITPSGKLVAREEFTPAKRWSFLVGEGEKSHTAQSRFLPLLEDDRKRPTLKDLEEAFSVEPITEEFFEAYRYAIKEVIVRSLGEGSDYKRRYAFAQQLLSRILFIYFLQRKKWLKWKDYEQDPNYMRNLWNKYKEYVKRDPNQKDTFYSVWLSSLFFGAFNKRSSLIDKRLPEEIQESFRLMPYLNGGLFLKNDLDEEFTHVPDSVFEWLFEPDLSERDKKKGFLEVFNFTIDEALPLDVEVAVDPEMLGRVYESLIAEEERGESGIFYTPRVEIDFMCRLSLVEYLASQTDIEKEKLIDFIFDPHNGVEKLTEKEAKAIKESLEDVKIVDPAVGSASFLVGMMNILVELHSELTRKIEGREENIYALKQKIIKENLYGVEVKDWAVMVGELRLWLFLVIETEEKYMDIYTKPLLPNLSFKIRQGDSLVEEIGGILISLRGENPKKYISPKIEAKIRELIDKKNAFFSGQVSADLREIKEIEELERNILKEILEAKIEMLEKEIKQAEFYKKLEEGKGLFGEVNKKEGKRKEEEIKSLKREKERLEEALRNIENKTRKDYFLWEIDFAEVFATKGGFDIVIGNPPYVRQELIAPPLEDKSRYTEEEWKKLKKEYKDRLESSVKSIWKNVKIDKKSDLYVYFYYHGLSLLREGGIFCFINSNSWLDVEYGAGLQEFLLKRMRPIYIIDNLRKRSFKQADVNTVIVLIQRPKEELDDYTVKFVAFKKPFEEVVNAEVIKRLESIKEPVFDDEDFRVFPKSKRELLLEGSEIPEEEGLIGYSKPEELVYVGNKWGGKYLRAPEIYFKILEKGKGKLVRLGDIAEVKAGIITGNNKKYYTRMIGEFDPLTYSPVFKSPREVNKILLTVDDAVWLIKIKDVPYEIRRAPLLWVDLRGDKHICHYNKDNLPFEHNFYGISGIKVDNETLCLILNSTLSWFFIEVIGRRGLGGGAIRLVKIDIVKLPILNNLKLSMNKFTQLINRPIHSIFTELGFDPNKPIREQEPNPLPDRKALDDIVFDALGLTEEERKEVYWAVAELVKNRLEKARSV